MWRAFGILLAAGGAAAAVHWALRPELAEASPRGRAYPPPAAPPIPPIAPVVDQPLPAPPPVAPPISVPISPGGSLYGRGGSYDPDYPPAIWFPLVASLVLTDYKRVDVRIAMKWLGMESDGAPCAFGRKGQYGPDGMPREIGLGQIYNPDDFKLLGLTARGITPATFRAYCAPNSQVRTRALTSKEMEDSVRGTLLDKIAQCMGVADHIVATYGLAWPAADYWKIVKAEHAWPPILNTGLPTVVKKLGRAPASWAEFRQAWGMDEMVIDQNPRSQMYQQSVPKHPLEHNGMNNCEKLASAVTAPGQV